MTTITPQMAERIELWPLDRLVPYARNPRTHGEEQIEQIAASIVEFGWTNPVLVDGEAGILAGHGRLAAARRLGLEQVPVVVLDHLSPAQRRAYIIADNKLALNAGWDEELLRQELAALEQDGFGLEVIGFSDEELAELLAGPAEEQAGLTDEDQVPEAPEQAVSKPGDLWILGPHRVLCGDATSTKEVARLMAGRKADLCFTSPPYAQQRVYEGGLADWDGLMQGVVEAAALAPHAQLLVNLGLVHRDGEWQPYWEDWIRWMRDRGWQRFGWYVWDQGPGLPGDWNGRLAPSHEFVFHFNRRRRTPNKTVPAAHAGEPLGGRGLRQADGSIRAKTGAGRAIQSHRIADSVLRVMRHKGGLGGAGSHPAVFPVALAAEVIAAFSHMGELVYEPFCGSGSQLLAADRLGRVCHALEIAPAYVDVAVRRWQAASGREAILDDGRGFAVVAGERQDRAA